MQCAASRMHLFLAATCVCMRSRASSSMLFLPDGTDNTLQADALGTLLQFGCLHRQASDMVSGCHPVSYGRTTFLHRWLKNCRMLK